jgi:hypothetical protein
MAMRRTMATVMAWSGICLSCAGAKEEGPKAPAAPPGVALASANGVAATAAATQPAAVDPLAWPRQFQEGGNTFVVYQPQLQKWEGDRLEAQAAAAVTPAGKTEPSYGVIGLSARTDIDKEDRMVTLSDLQFTKVSFPHAKDREALYVSLLRQHAVPVTREVSLDHLEANLAATASAKQAAATVAVKNDPPKVLFATSPSLLVLIDGEPVMRQVEGQKLMRVFNTRPLMLLDEATGTYYLHLMNRWAAAKAPQGPWAPAATVPATLEPVKASLAKAGTVDLLDPETPEAAPKQLPAILVSTSPAELVQTTGEPEYASIPGTALLYVKNTDSAVFKLPASGRFFLLVSGRWFAAPALTGPWAFVPGKSVPGDFAMIPPNSPKANVRLSVPGTPESQEAVIANSIPQTAAVKVAEAKLTVVYDGQPQFKPVAGAAGLAYAANTALPVIRIEADKTCWCVENGVWFMAPAPTGPWAVATAVPGVIYTIPLASPLHYVTYVRVYRTAPGVVYVGYTPGYMGTCVSTDGVVVYGTGYVYPAYVGTTIYVGYPPTYGYGAGFASGAATGFAFGFVAGAAVANCWSKPYWGPYYGPSYGYRYSHVDINSTNVYRNSRGGTTTVNRQANWETGEGGTAKRTASTFNPYTGRASAAGGKISMDNDGDYTAKRGAATYDPNTGIVRAGGTKVTGDLEDGDYQRKSGQAAYNTNTGTGVAKKGDDVYVAKDGEVYRHNDNKGWQQQTNDGWKDAQRDPSKTAQTQHLDSQRQARSVGQQRYESSGARASQRSYGGARGGGARGGRR